jgi:uncharacterized protein YndB with AHSA1/START domain
MLKKLLYLIVGIVLLLLGVAAFLPGSYTVERSVEIAAPPEVVYGQIADYNNWMKWSPWPKMEPTAKHTVSGTPGTVGMSWWWEGEQIGVGGMTLVEVEENRSIHSDLVFKEPMNSQADDYLLLEPTAVGTKVTWRNTGDLPYPVGRYFGLGLEGMLGPQFEEGLASLKSLCESMPAPVMEEAPPPETSAPSSP